MHEYEWNDLQQACTNQWVNTCRRRRNTKTIQPLKKSWREQMLSLLRLYTDVCVICIDCIHSQSRLSHRKQKYMMRKQQKRVHEQKILTSHLQLHISSLAPDHWSEQQWANRTADLTDLNQSAALCIRSQITRRETNLFSLDNPRDIKWVIRKVSHVCQTLLNVRACGVWQDTK